MSGSLSVDRCVARLMSGCRGTVSTDAESLNAVSHNFGRMVGRTPAVVVRPVDGDDLAVALQIAAEHELPVTTRGSGHSQSGQGVGSGLLLDLHGLERVLLVDGREGIVETEAGATWRKVVDATFERGLLPRSLTHVLDTTVGGTLSMAGVGAESFRIGPQVDNVRYLDVMTLEGEVVRCSQTEERELFDGVRAGLGQCGVILRAGHPVRPCRGRVQSRGFAYRAVDRFMHDVEVACESEGLSFVSGVFARDPRNPNAWILVLVVGFEHDGEGATARGDELVRAFAFDEELPAQDAPLWDATGIPGHMFFRLYAPPPGSIDSDPTTLHPWTEHLFTREAVVGVLEDHLRGRSLALSLGANGLIFVRRGPEPAPLFATPETDGMLWAAGMFASVPKALSDVMVPLLAGYGARGCALGGKRYLSGYVEFTTPEDWSNHYGQAWPIFQRLKARFDPKHLLNPGFIRGL